MSRSAAEEQGRGLTDVLSAFPGNSRQLLRLANDVMCKTGELSRGEREAIAAHVSKLNAVEYCVFYHSMFAEVFSSDSRDHTRDMSPLLSYAVALCNGKERDLALARKTALDLGWSEGSLYEVVEVCGLFSYINLIARSARLVAPDDRPRPLPDKSQLENSYLQMTRRLPDA